MLSDNSGYYVIQYYNTDYIPHVLKYSFSSPTTNQHYVLNSMLYYAYGTLMISDTELFWITRTYSTDNAVFISLPLQILLLTGQTRWAVQVHVILDILDLCWAQTSQRYIPCSLIINLLALKFTLVDSRYQTEQSLAICTKQPLLDLVLIMYTVQF